MANLAANDILEVKFFCSNANQQGINVLHYRVASVAGGNFPDSTLVDAMSALAGPIYRAWLPAVCGYLGCRLQRIFPRPQPIAQTSTGGAGAGAQATDPLPAITAFLVTKRSESAGPGGRGRVFLPFWPEGLNDVNGEPEAAGAALANNFRLQFLVPITIVQAGVTIVLTPILWNRDTEAATVITNSVLRDEWYHQDRRSDANKPDRFGP